MVNPDCLIIERNVPKGISFFGEGTMTVLLPFFNLAWLPFCETKTKPLALRALIICLDDGSLDIHRGFSKKGFVNNRQFCFRTWFVKIECKRFIQIVNGFLD